MSSDEGRTQLDKFLRSYTISGGGIQFFVKAKTDGSGSDVVAVNRGNNGQFLNGKDDPLI